MNTVYKNEFDHNVKIEIVQDAVTGECHAYGSEAYVGGDDVEIGTFATLDEAKVAANEWADNAVDAYDAIGGRVEA